MDPDEDYRYFQDVWNNFAAVDQSTVQDSPKLGSRCNLPPNRKKRKVVDDERRDDGTPNISKEDDGPIENMNFVKDQKETLGDAKMRKITGSSHSNVGDCIGSKYDGPAAQTPGGQGTDLLYQHFSIPDIDNLVGWATSHHNSLEKSAPSADELHHQERRLGLSHIPIAPPPPSHVEYLRECISGRLETNTPNILHDEGVDGNKKKMTAIQNDDTDASAYVAIGMAVEEVLTMALMPLAEAHIERCRRLERLKNWEVTSTGPCARKRPTPDPLHSWTLPPAEAMVQLARDGAANHNDELVSLLNGHSKMENISNGLD